MSGEMFADYVEWRAQHPSDDLMTELLQAEFGDETEPFDGSRARITYVNVVAGAGNETTNTSHRLGREGSRGASSNAATSCATRRADPERDRGAAALRIARHYIGRYVSRDVGVLGQESPETARCSS